jgi:hypothetical protein
VFFYDSTYKNPKNKQNKNKILKIQWPKTAVDVAEDCRSFARREGLGVAK